MDLSRSGGAGKERLKWTQELHNLFENTVNQLGGPDKNKFPRSNSHILPNFSETAGAQLHEALRMQIGVHRRLSDQNEVQRNLKVKVEAQGRFLERIAEEYKSRSNTNVKPSKAFIPISFPYRLKELVSEIKESESDSDIESFVIRSDEKLQGPKRLHVDQKDVALPRCKNFAPGSRAQQLMFVPRG
ncbi:myb family transcription factor RLI1-like [Apium graveolens]|uniref:myb family transcription factor RLI1-like n=1 Tax=Apium graveolens TaxID=4045 RepID=UPI003D7C07F8